MSTFAPQSKPTTIQDAYLMLGSKRERFTDGSANLSSSIVVDVVVVVRGSNSMTAAPRRRRRFRCCFVVVLLLLFEVLKFLNPRSLICESLPLKERWSKTILSFPPNPVPPFSNLQVIGSRLRIRLLLLRPPNGRKWDHLLLLPRFLPVNHLPSSLPRNHRTPV